MSSPLSWVDYSPNATSLTMHDFAVRVTASGEVLRVGDHVQFLNDKGVRVGLVVGFRWTHGDAAPRGVLVIPWDAEATDYKRSHRLEDCVATQWSHGDVRGAPVLVPPIAGARDAAVAALVEANTYLSSTLGASMFAALVDTAARRATARRAAADDAARHLGYNPGGGASHSSARPAPEASTRSQDELTQMVGGYAEQ